MIKTGKNTKKYLASLLAVFMLATLLVPASFAASNLYYSSESFADLSIVNGQMASDEGNATLNFTNDGTYGDNTFTVADGQLLVSSYVTCNGQYGSENMTYSDARLAYDLGSNVNGKVEVSFSLDLSGNNNTMQSSDNGATPEPMITLKNSNGGEELSIVYSGNTLWLNEAVSGNHLFGNAHGSEANNFNNINLVLDFAAGTVSATGTRIGADPITRTQNLKNGYDLRSILFNFNGNIKPALSEADLIFKLDDIAVQQLEKGSELYQSAESFSNGLSITNGSMASQIGPATLRFTNDGAKGDSTFAVQSGALVANSYVTCNGQYGSENMTYSDARLVYDLGANIYGKVEVSFSLDLSGNNSTMQSSDNGATPEPMITLKNSNGGEELNIVYSSNTLWLNEAISGNHLFGNAHGSEANNFNDIKLVLDFAAGTVTATGTKGGTVITRTQNLKSGYDLRSIVFNFNGNIKPALSSADLVFKLDNIRVTQTEKLKRYYTASEGFDAFAFTDGEISDTGYGSFTFVKDAKDAELQYNTFWKNGSNVMVSFLSTYDAATGQVTPSTAQMTYTLPEAVSGKVEFSMDVMFGTYLADCVWSDWLVAKDSKGNTLLDIDFANNNLFMFAPTDEVETACRYPGCTESGHNATYMHPSNFVSDWRQVKFVLDFDEGTIYFYRNGEITTHKSTGHTYILKIQNNCKDLKSLTFNFKGTATADTPTREWRANIDSLSVKQLALGAAESSIESSNCYLTADATMATIAGITAGDDITATVTVESQATTTQAATLYAALYDATDKLVQVVSQPDSIESTQEKTITTQIAVPEDIGTGAYIKLFVWGDNFRPFDEAEFYN